MKADSDAEFWTLLGLEWAMFCEWHGWDPHTPGEMICGVVNGQPQIVYRIKLPGMAPRSRFGGVK